MTPAAFAIGLSPDGLRPWLQLLQFWILEALFLAVVISTGVALPALARSLRAGAAWWLAAGAIALAAYVMVTALPPRTSRIFYDEQIYQDVGRNMAELRLAQTCHYGIVEYGELQCLAGEYNKEPYGYPYLLSLAYRVFGVHEWVAHFVNRASHALLVLLLCVTAARWFGDRTAGLFAGLAATILPEQLRWASTAAAEPIAAASCLLAVLAAVEFSRSRTAPALVWAVCTAAFAANTRAEALLVLVVCALVVITHAPDELRRPRLWAAAAAGVLLLAGCLGHLLVVRHEGWGAPHRMFALSHVAPNFAVNGWFYLWDMRFPIWLTPMAVLGAWRGAAEGRARAVTATYFVLFWAMFLFFYAGSYDFGADVRFSLMTYPPLMLLAGLGLAVIARALGRRLGRPMVARALVAAALGWMFLWQAPYVRAIGEEAWGARADVTFAREMAAALPANALVLTQDPNMFLLWGQSAAQTVLALDDPQFLRQAAVRHGGQVYFHWGFWCNVTDPVQQRLCSDLLAQAPHQVIRERGERTYRYAFYRLDIPK
jgi:hypothetical protein